MADAGPRMPGVRGQWAPGQDAPLLWRPAAGRFCAARRMPGEAKARAAENGAAGRKHTSFAHEGKKGFCFAKSCGILKTAPVQRPKHLCCGASKRLWAFAASSNRLFEKAAGAKRGAKAAERKKGKTLMMDIGTITRLGFGATAPADIESAGLARGDFLRAVEAGLAAGEADGPAGVQPATLEDRLKARYPGLVYHVFDASSRYWQTRQDFPFHKLYQQDCDGAEIENWRPSGPNPDMLSGEVQRNLGQIPPGSKAVIIHPKVQQKMQEDPAYAEEIYARIEAWFTFDALRNEAILPGSTMGMSQCVAIGEDGLIANVQACGSGGVTRSKDSDEDEKDFWEARTRRHRLYMQQVAAQQILQKLGISARYALLREAELKSRSGAAKAGAAMIDQQMAAMQASQLAIMQTMAMMNGPELRAALGETVAGAAVDAVFEATKNAIADFHPTAAL